jgi:hypothetical protein
MFLLSAAFAAGCVWWDDLSGLGLETSETATEQLQHAEADAIEARRAMLHDASLQRADLVNRLSKEVSDLQAEIDRLSARADRASGAAWEAAFATLEAMRRRWGLAVLRLEMLEGFTRPTWDEVKALFRKASTRCGMGSKDRACG